MKRIVIDAATGQATTVDMTNDEIEAFSQDQAALTIKAEARLAAQEANAARRAAHEAILHEQADKRAKDTDAPAEIKAWDAVRKARGG